ncbi:M20/M25/M40 family metallo-hydrolase [Aeromicrobium duanguangcaii]|uniref:M20/M25/M40 family metallo-hydrolase n=1 Tax=Aeromicrobium duanguangcaii TaxID=2968086 RepID=UPI002017EAAE|nr:M20/M25/M40 family metallo-hydrolase [Aeromicrobium duanguangcaii]MCL3837667.1 M20/M25/M40 family metallo-hydrolase [Aeromicrobium duanguangcaii]
MTAAERLAELIACRTVSAPGERDEAQFVAFRETFAGLYPRLHEALELTEFDGGTLLFRWPGRTSADPLVLMAHYDVVPAPAEQWDRDPFSGTIEGGFVHGRGALDDKGPLVCIAEAVESLLAEGFEPARDVYLSFGADEEVFGRGASDVVDHLESAGVRPWLVSDEGGAIVDDALPGVSAMTAMVAIVEKGSVDVGLLARGGGGHASTPSRHGTTARLARAVVRIERHPATPHLSDPVLQMLDALAELVPRPAGALLRRARRANRPAAELLARLGKETAAIVRTTMAVTQLSGSPARNVLATEARANVNVRLAIGDTKQHLVARLERLLRGLDVEVERVDGDDPPPVSRTDNDAWRALGDAIAVLGPDIHVVPYVQTGGTDSRHFTRISDSVYRFAPLHMTRAQRDSIHAPNEKVAVETLERGSAFHRALITGLGERP